MTSFLAGLEYKEYRGFFPNATIGSGKNSHQPKFALGKLGKNSQKNRTNEMNKA